MEPATSLSLTLRVAGGNPITPVEALEKLPGTVNYYIGNNPRKWHTHIPTYAEVRYRNVYPGVDLYYDGSTGALESHFVLRPGANPEQIRMAFTANVGCHPAGDQKQSERRKCAERSSRENVRPRLDHQGNLVIGLGGGEVRFMKPVAYQPAGRRPEGKPLPPSAANRTYVGARYVLEPGGEIGFAIASYDPARPLVIDPVLTYATYTNFKGAGASPVGIQVDASDNAYILGSTGAASSEQAVVLVLSPQGNSILYTTYLGGSSGVLPSAIAVDSQGDAYIDGTTGSGFPTTPGAYSASCPGICNTPFAAKLSPTGSLEYATYLGPSNATAHAIAIDTSGDAYITGTVGSTDLPVVNAFQSQLGCSVSTSCGNAFVQKLGPAGSQLIYSTYFGLPAQGTESAQGTGIAVDGSGSAYVVGVGTAVPLKNALEQGVGSTFLAKFTPDGSGLVYSTLLGGSGGPPNSTDSAVAVAVDATGDAFVTGDAVSPDFPVTMNAHEASCLETATATCGGPQTYVLEVAPDGTSLVYSTLIGRGTAASITLDSSGNVWVVGSTTSNESPAIQAIEANLQQNAYPSANSDAFLTRLNPSGTPNFSTFLGGSFSGETGVGVAVDSNGNAYVTGTTGVGNDTPIDFPIVNPAPGTQLYEQFYTPPSMFAAKIRMDAAGPAISLSPWYIPVLSLRNVSTSPLTINNITTSSDMTLQGGTCGSSLPPGGGCKLIVYPVDGSTFSSGTLTIDSNAQGSPQAFTINTSVPGTNQVFVTPGFSLGFPDLLAGSNSVKRTVTLTNLYYPNPIEITNIYTALPDPTEGTSGDFSQTNDCPATLPPGASCKISVQYQPTAGADGLDNSGLSIVTDTLSYKVGFDGAKTSESLVAFYPPGPADPTGSDIQFGIQYVGATPLPRVIPLVNTSDQSVSVTGISTSGPFSQKNNCSASLLPHGSCRVAVSFVPTGNMNATGSLNVAYDGQGGSLSVSLGGTGEILSDLGISAFTLNFPSTIVQSSTTLPLKLTNLSTSTLTLSAFNFSVNSYTETNDCNGSLAPAGSCTVNVTFTPTALGEQDGTLSIDFTGGNGSPQILSLTGSGRTPVVVTPSSLTFGQQSVGTVGASQSVSISNQSPNAVTLNSITPSANFQVTTNPCPGSLPADYACVVEVAFAPTAQGTLTGNLSIDASDSSSPHLVSLSGTGATAPAVSLSPTSLAFASLAEGSTSAPQTVTLKNIGSATLTIGSVKVTEDFTQTNTCGASLAAGASCKISVTFAPTTGGQLAGTVSIEDNAPDSPQVVTLSGTSNGPGLTLTPSTLTFPPTLVGELSPSGYQLVTLTNSGNAALDISGITTSGDFSEKGSCSASIAAGGGCTINVEFGPTAGGTRTGQLKVADNADGSPQSIPLTGTGMDFSVAAASGSSTTQTVAAGQSATYTVALSGTSDFTGAVSLSCTGAPSLATCTVNPTGLLLNGTQVEQSTVTITTTAPSITPPDPQIDPPSSPGRAWPLLLALMALLAACSILLKVRSLGANPGLRPAWIRRTVLAMALLGLTVCATSCGGGGGGGGSSSPPKNPGTPSGNYSLTVVGTFKSGTTTLTHKTTLQLDVQ